MLTFRQKIFVGYLGAFLVFLILMYPFATRTVQRIAIKTMVDRVDEVIDKLQTSPNDEAMVRRLKDEKPLIFFRAAIIDNHHKLLYDTAKRLQGPEYSQDKIVDYPEVIQAFKEGVGYHEDFSTLLRGQKFVYVAKAFDFHGKTYVLRTAFPHRFVMELTNDFKLGASILAVFMLLLFSVLTWFIINHLTRPIQDIITTIRPYQMGEVSILPEVAIVTSNPNDEFGRLAETLNNLSGKIRGQINTLTFERNEKEAVLESLAEGVIAVESDLTVTYANNTALRFLGMRRDALVGRHYKMANEEHSLQILEECLQQQRIIQDTVVLKRNQGKLHVDLIASPIKYASGAVVVFQDKTQHYKLLEMRKDFVANASHELKTPLTIIRGFAETLHDNPQLEEDVKSSITDKIVRNCLKMSHLIKDLLAITDIENLPESRLVQCDLSEILEACCRSVQQLYPEATIRFNHYAPFVVVGDPGLLELAFNNLIENGAKYSTSPAEVIVDVTDQDGWMMVSIADKGFGIPEDEIDRIFRRFYRVESSRQRAKGSGLGLSIVEMIVEKHFGKIRVSSEVGKGSVFNIFLPASPE